MQYAQTVDHDGANIPELRTALIARELDKYKIQTAVLTENCKVGVGFSIKSNWVKKISGPLKCVNDCLMTVQLSFSGKQYGTLLSTLASTKEYLDDVKERFYEDL